ncbi:MAG: hypothetical protein ABIB93_06860 [Chloroflexota bacterium]
MIGVIAKAKTEAIRLGHPDFTDCFAGARNDRADTYRSRLVNGLFPSGRYNSLTPVVFFG